DSPQHRVGEAGRARRHHLHQPHRGADGGVRRYPGVEQLVGAEPQRVACRWVDPVHRPIGGGGDDLVEGSLPAQGAVRELGGEGGVPVGEVGAGQDRRQHQVGVRVVAVDGGHRLVGGVPRGLAGCPPVLAPPIPVATLPVATPLPVAAPAAVPPPVTVTLPPPGWGHPNRSPAAGRTPRIQSSAAICLRPAGWTCPSATGVVAVPTRTRRWSSRISPGASGGSSVTCTGPSLTRSPRKVVHAPGAG